MIRMRRRESAFFIWYNPPYSANVKTNIGKIFFKRFPRGHKFYEICNKNTVQLSYSSTKNMASLTILTWKNMRFSEFSTKNHSNTRLAACDVFHMFTRSIKFS